MRKRENVCDFVLFRNFLLGDDFLKIRVCVIERLRERERERVEIFIFFLK